MTYLPALSVAALLLSACAPRPAGAPSPATEDAPSTAPTPRPGSAAIVVGGGVPQVHVVVDGEVLLSQRACDVPCVIDGIEPGPHLIAMVSGPPGDSMHRSMVDLPADSEVTLRTSPTSTETEPTSADYEEVGSVVIGEVNPLGTAPRTSDR